MTAWFILRVNGTPRVLRTLDDAVAVVTVLRITLPGCRLTLRRVPVPAL